jgi:hypothetical protein
MKLLHLSIYWHGADSTILLIKEDFPAYMTHNKKDDKEIIHGADSSYILFGVSKTPAESLGAKPKLSVSVRSVYKPFSSPDDVGSMFLRIIGT